MTDRGVSDIIGFVLMFSVIIGSVAIIGTAGVTQLSDLSERESVSSSTASMSHFAGTVDDLNRQGAIFRTAALSPAGGTIWVNDSVAMEIAVGGSSVGTFDIDAIEHRLQRSGQDVSVVYEAGAVFRTDGGLAQFQPTIRCLPGDRASVSLVNLSATESLHVGGGASGPGAIQPGEFPDDVTVISTENSIELGAGLANTKVVYSTRNGPARDLTIDMSRTIDPQQWNQTLVENGPWEDRSTTPDFHYTCPAVETVLVRIVDVELTA